MVREKFQRMSMFFYILDLIKIAKVWGKTETLNTHSYRIYDFVFTDLLKKRGRTVIFFYFYSKQSQGSKHLENDLNVFFIVFLQCLSSFNCLQRHAYSPISTLSFINVIAFLFRNEPNFSKLTFNGHALTVFLSLRGFDCFDSGILS